MAVCCIWSATLSWANRMSCGYKHVRSVANQCRGAMIWRAAERFCFTCGWWLARVVDRREGCVRLLRGLGGGCYGCGCVGVSVGRGDALCRSVVYALVLFILRLEFDPNCLFFPFSQASNRDVLWCTKHIHTMLIICWHCNGAMNPPCLLYTLLDCSNFYKRQTDTFDRLAYR